MSYQLKRSQQEKERERGGSMGGSMGGSKGKGLPAPRLEVATLVSVKERARMLLYKSKMGPGGTLAEP